MALKLTRKAFNRRLIAFALTALTSVSLTSVGFTAFIVSSDATKAEKGNVEVSAITEASMNFVDLMLGDNPNFIFEAAEGDNTGRIRSDGKNFENLTVTLSGRLEHSQYLDYITIYLQLPEGIQQAIEDNYICAPVCVRDGIELGVCSDETNPLIVAKREDYTATATGIITFSFDIKFTWGETFGWMNPSIYFDTVGKEIHTDDEMTGMLQEFRKMVYGIDDPNATSESFKAGYDTYYLTITAHTN